MSKKSPYHKLNYNPQNARTSHLTLDEIIRGPKLDTGNFDEFSQKNFQTKLEAYFEKPRNRYQKINEYMSLAQLAASIGTPDNLINPVTVFLKDMDFYLIAGHRRTLAHLILGADGIIAKILAQAPNHFEHSLIQWKENKDREDLSLSDEIESIAKVISHWENVSGEKISVRKLMGILNLRKTKSANYLAVIKTIETDLLFQKAIATEKLTSLELAYNIASMTNPPARQEILQDLLAGIKFSYKQLMAKIKNPELSVRTPDTLKFSTDKSHGLTLSRKTNVVAIAKILKMVIKSPELRSFQLEFEKINLASKVGIIAAWEKIYQIFAK